MKFRKPTELPHDRSAPMPATAPAWPPERQLWKRRRAVMETRRDRSTPEGSLPPYWTPMMKRGTDLFGAMAKRSGFYARGHRNALDVRARFLPLTFPGLPEAFEGYRILHITDPHFDAMEGLGEAIHNAVRGFNVDLCVLTGDYRAANGGPFVPRGVMEPLSAILESVSASDGFFATLGNHDSHEMVEAFEALGLPVLINETVNIPRGPACLSVTGVDDVYRYFTPMAPEALRQSPDFGPGHFGLALVHSPELAVEASEAGYSLYLCGHTHGGQICPPGGRPLLVPMSRNRSLARGLWQVGGLTGYTSRGAGVTGLPLRYFAPAEVTVITLTRAGAK